MEQEPQQSLKSNNEDKGLKDSNQSISQKSESHKSENLANFYEKAKKYDQQQEQETISGQILVIPVEEIPSSQKEVVKVSMESLNSLEEAIKNSRNQMMIKKS